MNKTKAILIGAGPIEKITPFTKEEKDSSLLLCCDGGYKVYKKLGIEPDLFVGDFDTLNPNDLGHPKEKVVLNPVKDDTDTFYAIKKALRSGIKEFTFYGCLGGKMEHTIANLQVLSYLLDQGARGTLISPNESQFITMGEKCRFDFYPNAKGMLSLFSYSPESVVSEHHLKYTLEKATLTSSIPLGVSNEFIDKVADIEVEEGRVLLVAPTHTLKKVS